MINYVLCQSIANPAVQAVFEGLQCPIGWYFINVVQ
jgi:hypothetical protein